MYKIVVFYSFIIIKHRISSDGVMKPTVTLAYRQTHVTTKSTKRKTAARTPANGNCVKLTCSETNSDIHLMNYSWQAENNDKRCASPHSKRSYTVLVKVVSVVCGRVRGDHQDAPTRLEQSRQLYPRELCWEMHCKLSGCLTQCCFDEILVWPHV